MLMSKRDKEMWCKVGMSYKELVRVQPRGGLINHLSKSGLGQGGIEVDLWTRLGELGKGKWTKGKPTTDFTTSGGPAASIMNNFPKISQRNVAFLC